MNARQRRRHRREDESRGALGRLREVQAWGEALEARLSCQAPRELETALGAATRGRLITKADEFVAEFNRHTNTLSPPGPIPALPEGS